MWTERVGYARLVDDRYVVGVMRGVTMHGTIESFMYMTSLRTGNSITSKVTSPLGYSMDFVLLSLMTQKPNVPSGSSLE